MQEHSTQRQGSAAFIWKWGATCGFILGLIQGILALFSLGLFATIIDLLIWLVGFFLVGMFAARETGRAGTGSLVGLVMGLVGGLIAAIVGIVLFTINGPQITPAISQAVQTAQSRGRSISADEIVTIGIVISLTFTVIVELSLGAGIGALGGLVGRHQAMPVADPYQTPQQ